MIQFHPNDIASNLIVSNGMVMRGNLCLFFAKPSDTMVLIGGDADGFFVLKQLIPLHYPIGACRIHVWDRFQEIIRASPNQYAVGIILNIVTYDLKIHAIFYSDPCLAVVVDLIVLQRAVT
jgi:hypothetical protein